MHSRYSIFLFLVPLLFYASLYTVNAQRGFAQKVFQLNVVDLPPTTDPKADLTIEQLTMVAQQESELYETIIRTRKNKADKYIYRPIYLSQPESRTAHERIKRCVTTETRTRCINEAGNETSGYRTGDNKFNRSLMRELAELVSQPDTMVFLGPRSSSASDDTWVQLPGGVDTITHYADDGTLEALIVASPPHRIDYWDSTHTQVTYFRYDDYLRKILPAKQFDIKHVRTRKGDPGTLTRATFYSPYYDPDFQTEDLERLVAAVYPNPVGNRLRIRPGTSGIVVHVNLYDPAGRQVISTRDWQGGIDVAHLPPGTYVVELHGDAATPFITQIVKQ